MPNLKIISRQSNRTAWIYAVSVGRPNDLTEHIVTIDKEYWRKLTGEKKSPDELLEKSFQFLLHRESKESILPSFNLEQINSYFPDYEESIKNSIPA